MIEIKKIYIKSLENTSKLCADIIYKEKKQTLWYEVEKQNEKFLCHERADAFVCALLLFAMQHNEDIKVENTPISEKLYFNMINYIIPAFSKLNGRYKNIRIIAETTNEKIKNYNHNGTGFSRGVDSFMTLQEHSKKQLNVDCLTFFNVGSHGNYGGEEARILFKKRMKRSKEVAEKNNYKFIWIDSNISDFLNQVFIETHVFRSMSAVFAIQKTFSNYYYSSGYTIYEFKVNETSPAKFETYLLSMLSNENVKMYSSGCLYNRLEKVEKIKDYELAQNNLNVCFREGTNCGICEKCVRTIFELYALKSLENFSNVFDVNHFNNNKNWYEKQFMKYYYLKKQDYIDSYKKMKEEKIRIKTCNKIGGLLLAIYSKTKNAMPKKLKEILRGKKNAK